MAFRSFLSLNWRRSAIEILNTALREMFPAKSCTLPRNTRAGEGDTQAVNILCHNTQITGMPNPRAIDGRAIMLNGL